MENNDIDFVLQYDGLVYSIINKFSFYGDRDDLYQVSMIALLNAYKNYNKESSTAKFSSYAYFYIVGEVTEYIRKSKPYKVSKDIIKLSKKVEYVRDYLRQKLGREVSDLEVSLYLDIDINMIASINEINLNVKSLDDVYNDDNNSYYNSVSVYDNNLDSDIMDLRNELNKLSAEEKKIIYDKYYRGYSQSEISKELGMSQAQVSRKENKILEKLKVRL